jgi:uncharacterized protein YbbC (DUF1343 family)
MKEPMDEPTTGSGEESAPGEGWSTGLDALVADTDALFGRRFGFLGHAASVTAELEPGHLALARREAPPAVLFGPEHGYFGVEQDMVPSADQRDPWTGVPIRSLYGSSEATLKPAPEAFEGLDLLLIDLQDVGSRYYTFAATAIWSAEVALAAGLEVWFLDRPNPIGGVAIEGGSIADPFHSFVGAFATPVRHGLTVGELARLEARRRRWPEGWAVWRVDGWRREQRWGTASSDGTRPWIAPSPNMPDATTALLYPGLCLIEATTLSEGRGTTRPFKLVGAPGVEAMDLADELAARELPGLKFLPTYFRPQFQKHRGEVCGGIEIAVVDADAVAPYRAGIEILRALRAVAPDAWSWRAEPYEFVIDRPAIDLLTGSSVFREALDGGAGSGDEAIDRWIAGWAVDETAFERERREIVLYP